MIDASSFNEFHCQAEDGEHSKVWCPKSALKIASTMHLVIFDLPMNFFTSLSMDAIKRLLFRIDKRGDLFGNLGFSQVCALKHALF